MPYDSYHPDGKPAYASASGSRGGYREDGYRDDDYRERGRGGEAVSRSRSGGGYRGERGWDDEGDADRGRQEAGYGGGSRKGNARNGGSSRGGRRNDGSSGPSRGPSHGSSSGFSHGAKARNGGRRGGFGVALHTGRGIASGFMHSPQLRQAASRGPGLFLIPVCAIGAMLLCLFVLFSRNEGGSPRTGGAAGVAAQTTAHGTPAPLAAANGSQAGPQSAPGVSPLANPLPQPTATPGGFGPVAPSGGAGPAQPPPLAAKPFVRPEFDLKPLHIGVPIDRKTFQGPLPPPDSDADIADYEFQAAWFGLSPEGDLSLPENVSNVAALAPTLTNPYTALALSIKLDKIGDNAGRLLIVTPESVEGLEESFRSPEFVARSKEIFAHVEGIHMLLTVEAGDKIIIYFMLTSAQPNDPNQDTVYMRSFSKVGDRYLVDISPIREAAVVNILSTLSRLGPGRLIIRANPLNEPGENLNAIPAAPTASPAPGLPETEKAAPAPVSLPAATDATGQENAIPAEPQSSLETLTDSFLNLAPNSLSPADPVNSTLDLLNDSPAPAAPKTTKRRGR